MDVNISQLKLNICVMLKATTIPGSWCLLLLSTSYLKTNIYILRQLRECLIKYDTCWSLFVVTLVLVFSFDFFLSADFTVWSKSKGKLTSPIILKIDCALSASQPTFCFRKTVIQRDNQYMYRLAQLTSI